MHKKIALAVSFAALLAAGATQADDTTYTGFQAGDIMIRGRGLVVLPTVTSSVSSIGGTVDASKSVVPELDASYFFTKNIAVEAIAAVSPHHLVDKGSTSGNLDLGHVLLLPPTVTAQYHFMPTSAFNPYLGMGVNYTWFFNEAIPAHNAVHTIRYDNAWGAAFQAGADYHIRGNWYGNIDVKHIFLQTHAKINGTIGADVNIDPTIVGLGVGYKF
jgi:outer membrane protein